MKTSELIKSHFFIHFLFILLYSTQNNSRKKSKSCILLKIVEKHNKSQNYICAPYNFTSIMQFNLNLRNAKKIPDGRSQRLMSSISDVVGY